MNSLRFNGRSNFGYQQPAFRQTNIIIQNYSRNLNAYADINEYYDGDMEGDGRFTNFLRKAASGVKKAATFGLSGAKKAANAAWKNREAIASGAVEAGTKAAEFYGSEQGTTIKNMLPSSDKNSRASFPGEKHAILQLPNGRYGTANYMGPGTEIIKRVRRGDPPRTASDKVAMRHDIDYALSTKLKTKEAQIKAIRIADKRMMKALDKIELSKKDSKKNIYMGREIIRAKTVGEDIGLMNEGSFGDELGTVNSADLNILLSKRKELSGKGKPGQKLKKKLIKRHGGNGTRLAGSGTSLAGGFLFKNNKGILSNYAGNGTRLAGQKGGFIFSLAAIGAAIAAAVTSGTAASIATTVGAAAVTIATEKIVSKMAGDGHKMKGAGIADLIKKYTKKIQNDNKKLISKVKNITVKTHELPSNIKNKAQKVLGIINKNPTTKKIESVVKFLIPQFKKLFNVKIKPITAKLGLSGGSLVLSDKHILEKVMKNL